jgi:peptidoglycan/xylan/chitin deacetylase (PgdA/CDA1 family)
MIRKLLTPLASYLPLNRLIQWSHQRFIFPFYHLITDHAPAHIKHLYTTRNIQTFENDLDFFLRHFECIHPENLRKKEHFPATSFLLTFDDGLSEFYDVVAPILRRKGVPAICFLNSNFVDNKDLFFRYKASLLIEALENNPQLFEEVKLPEWVNVSNFKQVLKRIDYGQKHHLDTLADLIGFSFKDYLQQQQPYMNSSEILELIDQGFYFGGHSIDHPLYHAISKKEQWRQTYESVQFAQKSFNLPNAYFAFPFTDFDVKRTLFDQMESKNIISFGTAGLKKQNFPHHFQRIPMEIGDYSAQQIIHTEYLYYLIKEPLGKNKIRRV